MPAPSKISLDQLIALSEEMAALVRSGVPLERGLWHLGSDIPGAVGELAQRLSTRLERGESLDQVLAGETGAFPPVYRAVIAAGLKSGRLALALEGLVKSARCLAELRRTIGLALFYPLVVLLLAHGLFVFFVLQVAPELKAAYEGLQIPPNWLLDGIASLGPSASIWGPLVPAVVLIGAALWWWLTRRALLIEPNRSLRLLGWVPWVGKLVRQTQQAMFAEVFALLIEHDIPLPEALRLAAATTGDADTHQAAAHMANSVEQGAQHALQSGSLTELPPLLGWLLSQPSQQATLVVAARDAADNCTARAAYQAELVRLLLPIGATAVVGGLVTLFYAVTLFIPWSNLLQKLH